MMVKVYVDWDAHEILTAEEYEKKLQEETLSVLEVEDEFNDWLEERYLPQVIWHMTEAGRAEVRSLWEDSCRDYAEAQLDYEETYIEV